MPDADGVFEVVDSEPECCDGGTATPSYAESCFMDGATDRNSEILVIPSWSGVDCTDGVWEHPPRGDRETAEDGEQDADRVPANGHSGHFGIMAGSWGGKWKDKDEDDHMHDDIMNSGCQVILLQEVEPRFWDKMRKRMRMMRDHQVAPADMMPLFVGVKGEEGNKENSLLIAGNPSIVLGCRLRVFHRTVDGNYREHQKR